MGGQVASIKMFLSNDVNKTYRKYTVKVAAKDGKGAKDSVTKTIQFNKCS